MRRWITSLWVAAILCISFYGCGLIPHYITLTYHAQENVNRIEEAGNVAIKVKVVDLRTEASDLGTEKEVGYPAIGFAPINANNDLKDLVGYAIETELTHRGFNSGERVLIEVDLIKFYSSHAFFDSGSLMWWHGTVAILILHIDVKKPDGTLIYSNLVRGNIGTRLHFRSMSHPKEDRKIALEAALKDGISKLVNDPEFIKSLIKASVN